MVRSRSGITGHLALIPVFLAIAMMLPASSCMAGSVRSFDQVRTRIVIGHSKQSIHAVLGEPDAIRIIRKSKAVIWGPEESFWDDIPLGAALEVWNYRLADGSLNLYFVNRSEKLDHMAFAPRGVVY